MKTLINWKVFLILWIAAILAILAVMPYTLELQSSALTEANLPIPLPVLLVLQIVQNAVLFGVLISIGLFFAGRVGLGTPILEARVRGESVAEKVRAILPVSVILGVIAAGLIIGLDIILFQPLLLRELGNSANALNLQNVAASRLERISCIVLWWDCGRGSVASFPDVVTGLAGQIHQPQVQWASNFRHSMDCKHSGCHNVWAWAFASDRDHPSTHPSGY